MEGPAREQLADALLQIKNNLTAEPTDAPRLAAGG
jgi:hypothetical protein